MWQIDEDALESISIGAGILGTGGGGNPYIGMLRARELVRAHGPVEVLALDELPEDSRVICVGGMGAPTVGVEKVRGTESYRAVRAIEKHTGERATALISGEIGGSNSLEPVIPASLARLPVVDGDGMGRAFPELQMTTFFIYGIPPTPTAVCDEKGNTAIIEDAVSPTWVERMARAVTIVMGCAPVFAFAPMSAADVRRTAIPGTLSLAKSLGDAVRRAQREKANPIDAILATVPGRVLFQGKIADVERRTTEGFARGRVTIDGMGDDAGAQLVVDFQNENLVAHRDGAVIVTVPDLICIVDAERGEPITTELLRYGFRVSVLGFPAPPLLKTPEALAVVGPQAFGYEAAYVPLEP
ncbi:MAG: hydantoinase [Gemmatimonas sp. SM23_52]|nr:MAG: hydantoinase [Gemmatimonas sp. SM23_52]